MNFAAFFASGHAVDLVLAVMLVEAIVLIARRHHVLSVALTLLPGAMMMLALRAALTGAGWRWIALWLALSWPVHLADLRMRGR